MRLWFEALAEPNRTAAQVLTSNPMKVRTLGLMRESASQRTMVSSRTPQARPKAEVQLMEEEAVIGERINLTTNDNLRLRSGQAGPSKGRGRLPAPDCVAL